MDGCTRGHCCRFFDCGGEIAAYSRTYSSQYVTFTQEGATYSTVSLVLPRDYAKFFLAFTSILASDIYLDVYH